MAGLPITHHAAQLTTLIAVASSASMGRHCDVAAEPASDASGAGR